MVQRRTTSAPVTLPCPRIGMHTNLVKALSSAVRFRIAAEFMCFPRVIETPMPKKITPKLRALHPVDDVLQPLDRQAGFRHALPVHRLVLDQRAQRRRHLEVLARPYLEKDVRGLRAGRFANVDQDHGSALAALRHELALLA